MITWTDGGVLTDQAGRIFNNQPGGILQIDAQVSFSMMTINNAGTLRLQAPAGGALTSISCATFTNSGTLDLKSGGGLQMGGDFSQTSTGAMSFTLNGTPPGTNYCPFVGGNNVVSLDGTLNVSLASGYTPLDHDTYRIMFFGGITHGGDFATKNLPGLSTGLLWSSVYTTPPSSELDLTVTSGPVISSITPNTGASSAGTVTTTIQGVHLPQGATAKLTKGGQPDIVGTVTNVSKDGAQMTASFNLTGAASGYWDVVVAEPAPGIGSSTLREGFGINVLGVNSISPNLGRVGTQVNVTISGSGFASGATVQMSRGLQTISGTVQVIDTTTTPQTITATFSLPPQGSNPSPLGKWDVVVTNTDSTSGKLSPGFTIHDAPVVTSVSPTWGYWDQTVTLTIIGSSFVNGATVKLQGPSGERAASSVAFGDSTQIAATINLASPQNANPGLYSVTVTNPDGGQVQLPAVFEVKLPPPTITSITPNTGLNTGPVNVTLVGTNFLGPTAVKLTKTNLPDIVGTISSVSTDWTRMDATFDLNGAAAGLRDVVVVNGDGQTGTLPDGFTVNAASPEINLKQGTTNITDGGSCDFGSKAVSTNTDVVFTIENTGTADLTLTTPLTIGGANADQFSLQSQPTSPVAGPTGTTTFTIRFTPTSAGAKTATISIANNDGDENPLQPDDHRNRR